MRPQIQQVPLQAHIAAGLEQPQPFQPKTVFIAQYHPRLRELVHEANRAANGSTPLQSGLFVLEDVGSEIHRTAAQSDTLMMGGLYCDNMEDLLVKTLRLREQAFASQSDTSCTGCTTSSYALKRARSVLQ